MAEDIFQTEKYKITEFWGGKDQGECLQITPLAHPDYIQLNKDEVRELANFLNSWLGSKKKAERSSLMCSARDELKKIIQDQALLYSQNWIRLSSGGQSQYYLDIKRISLAPKAFQLIGYCIYEKIKNLKFNGIGGPVFGAVPLVAAVINCLWKNGRWVEGFAIRSEAKQYGMQRQIEGNLEEITEVVLVDDVLTTGQSLLKAAKVVQSHGLKIKMIVVLVDREEGGKDLLLDHGFPVKSVFTLSEILGGKDG